MASSDVRAVARATPQYLQAAGVKRQRPEPAGKGANAQPARAPGAPAVRAGGGQAPAARLSEAEERARAELPVCAGRAELLRELELHDSLVVMAETGSGKTTQIPQFLYDAGCVRSSAARGTLFMRRQRANAARASTAPPHPTPPHDPRRPPARAATPRAARSPSRSRGASPPSRSRSASRASGAARSAVWWATLCASTTCARSGSCSARAQPRARRAAAAS